MLFDSVGLVLLFWVGGCVNVACGCFGVGFYAFVACV